MRTIWLIRHGESESNAGQVTASPVCIPLSERGRREAADIAMRFPRAPDLLVVSGYIRTRLTAEPLLARFPHTEVAERPIHEFTFLAPSRYAGTTIHQRREPVREYWERCAPDFCDGEGAETFDDFMRRIRAFLGQLRLESKPFTAIYAHAYIIKAFIWETLYHGDRSSPEFMRGFRALHQNLRIPNGTILPIHLSQDGNLFTGSPWVPPYVAPMPPIG
jgi:broad specificity phosphatase PhoE